MIERVLSLSSLREAGDEGEAIMGAGFWGEAANLEPLLGFKGSGSVEDLIRSVTANRLLTFVVAARSDGSSARIHRGSVWLASISIWEFPKIRGTLSCGPCIKDPTTLSTILGSPYFRKLPFQCQADAADPDGDADMEGAAKAGLKGLPAAHVHEHCVCIYIYINMSAAERFGIFR